MAKLSDAQIASYAAGAGWSGGDVATAVAVALAESGGDPGSLGDVALENSTWGPSVGLWQIRSLKADKGTGRTRDELANKDPATNARHAHEIWAGAGGFKPWTTYTTGLYLPFIARGEAAAGKPADPATPATQTADIVPVSWWNPLDWGSAVINIAKGMAAAGAWLGDRHNWNRILITAMGAATLVGGLVVLAKPIVDPIAQQVGGVAKQLGEA